MKISGKNVFYGHQFRPLTVEFTDKIDSITPFNGNDESYDDCYIIPGLVDIHTHAAVGCDCSDGDVSGLKKMCDYYACHGVTSFCPATMTIDEDSLLTAVRSILKVKQTVTDDKSYHTAKIAGINLEGPFVSKEKCGAQNPENIRKPDLALFHQLNEVSGNLVKIVTIAPEGEGAVEFIKEVSKCCTVSLGHTSASYDTAMKAFSAGSTHVTHLFNAMPPLLHRAPGIIGAASDADCTVELICDGLHIHPSVIRLVYRLFGKRVCLISDSLRCAGMPDGEYMLGGQMIEMKNGVAVLKGTDTLAGSSVSLHTCLKRAVYFGISLEEAVYSATTAPARAIKADNIGTIEKGKSADFVVLDKELNIRAVFIDGKEVNF